MRVDPTLMLELDTWQWQSRSNRVHLDPGYLLGSWWTVIADFPGTTEKRTKFDPASRPEAWT